MRRVTLILATFAVLCLAAGQARADGYHHGHGGYGGHHGGYYGPMMVRPLVRIAPPVVVPAPIFAPAYPVAPTGYPYWNYYPGPSYGFYYQGRGVSVGVGF
jgi:hypothetical protein